MAAFCAVAVGVLAALVVLATCADGGWLADSTMLSAFAEDNPISRGGKYLETKVQLTTITKKTNRMANSGETFLNRSQMSRIDLFTSVSFINGLPTAEQLARPSLLFSLPEGFGGKIVPV